MQYKYGGVIKVQIEEDKGRKRWCVSEDDAAHVLGVFCEGEFAEQVSNKFK
jgi:hypothetical protein